MSINANIKLLIWESKFFKCKTAKLIFAPHYPIICLKKLEKFQIVQAKIKTKNINLIKQLINIGFKIANTEINYDLNIIKLLNKNIFSKIKIEFATTKDIKFLKKIASNIFLHSRFCYPWYNVQDKNRFYATWMENAINGTFDDVCLLIKNHINKIYGFVTIKKIYEKKTAKIGLLATLPLYRKKSIGKKLIIAACQWCNTQGINKLKITTQINNIHAIHLYSKIGAKFKNSFYWLYRGSK